MKAAEERNKKI